MTHSFEAEIAGRTLAIETGRLAAQAGGAVTIRYGDTMMLGTATASKPRPGIDFFPLSVEFEERLYAAGRIPGSFFRREGRPQQQPDADRAVEAEQARPGRRPDAGGAGRGGHGAAAAGMAYDSRPQY